MDTAKDYFDSGEYTDAIYWYNRALEINDDSLEASQGITEAQGKYLESVIAQADENISAGNYNGAANVIKSALESYPDDNNLNSKLADVYIAAGDNDFSNKDYLSAIEWYTLASETNDGTEKGKEGISKSKEAYISNVVSIADNYIKERDYDSASYTLKEGLEKIPDSTALKQKLNGLDDVKIQDIVDDAYTAADRGKWDEAIDILEKAQSSYTSNEKLSEAYEDIKEKMPITLKNITTISSDHVKIDNDPVKDRYGNVYDGAVKFESGWWSNAQKPYALYNLSGKYSSLKATVFSGVTMSNGASVSLSIYVDEELVFFKENITDETAPFEISVVTSGKQTLRIVAIREQGDDSSIYFGNSEFIKING